MKNTGKVVTRLDNRRRSLLKALSASALAPLGLSCTLNAQTSASGIDLQKIHCFELRVSDVERTVAFYQDLFGMPVISTFGGRTCLGIGESSQFMAVRALQEGEVPAITSLGYSVADYSRDGVLAGLKSIGIDEIDAPDLIEPGLTNANKSWVRLRDGTPEVYFADGRGVIVQLSDDSYCGGSGPLGSVCVSPQPSAEGLFKLSEINHFTAFVNDGAGANTFYQENFCLEVQAYQGPGSPVTGIGDGYQFVMYAGPFGGGADAPASLNHGCFNMHDFDEDAILSAMTKYGLKDRGSNPTGPMVHYVSRRMPARGGVEGGTPEVYFTDPDGILMQLQDVTYCGGGGYLGNECIKA